MDWPQVFVLEALSQHNRGAKRTPCDRSPFQSHSLEASFFIPNSAAFDMAGGQDSAACRVGFVSGHT